MQIMQLQVMEVLGIGNNKFRNWDIKKDTFETNKIRGSSFPKKCQKTMQVKK